MQRRLCTLRPVPATMTHIAYTSGCSTEAPTPWPVRQGPCAPCHIDPHLILSFLYAHTRVSTYTPLLLYHTTAFSEGGRGAHSPSRLLRSTHLSAAASLNTSQRALHRGAAQLLHARLELLVLGDALHDLALELVALPLEIEVGRLMPV